ncbi:MAG TPA: DUF4258 domain-containing protein [Candidatus Binatia bacterium]|nr:DUF4258 domain-containing protein [Candidatus Binatia bacterium]
MRMEYSRHAREQMEERGITSQDVLDALHFPDATVKRYGQYFARRNLDRGVLCVAYERGASYIKIITVWWL